MKKEIGFALIVSMILAFYIKNRNHNDTISYTSAPSVSDSVSLVNRINERERLEKVYNDSVKNSSFKTDEYGLCEGEPKSFEVTNDAEKNLLSSIDKCYTACIDNDKSAFDFICPKAIKIIKERYPDIPESRHDSLLSEAFSKGFSELESLFKDNFGGYKKSSPIVTQLYKLPSKEGNLIYSVHYSIGIYCSNDNKNYKVWHYPMFMYAVSQDNGGKWYFVNISEGYMDILKDFK